MIELSIEASGVPEGLAELLERVSEACLAEEGLPDMISFGRVVDDEEVRRVNREFRGMDKPTDVLSFPSINYPPGTTARTRQKRLRRERDPESGRPSLGDFMISLPTAQRQADEYGHPLLRELAYLTAHAQFHLMGYDHEKDEDKRVMREKEERVMRALNLGREEDT